MLKRNEMTFPILAANFRIYHKTN